MEKNNMYVKENDNVCDFRVNKQTKEQQQQKSTRRSTQQVPPQQQIDQLYKLSGLENLQIITMKGLIKKVRLASIFLYRQKTNIVSFFAFLGGVLQYFDPKKVKIDEKTLKVAYKQLYKCNLLLLFEKQSNLKDIGNIKQKNSEGRAQSLSIKSVFQNNQQFQYKCNLQQFCFWIISRLLGKKEQSYLLQFLQIKPEQSDQITTIKFLFIYFGFKVWLLDQSRLLIIPKFNQNKLIMKQIIPIDSNITQYVQKDNVIFPQNLKVFSTNKDLSDTLADYSSSSGNILSNNKKDDVLCFFQDKNKKQININYECILNNNQLQSQNENQNADLNVISQKNTKNEFYDKSRRRPQGLQNNYNFVENFQNNFQQFEMSQHSEEIKQGKGDRLRGVNNFLRHQDILMLRNTWNSWLRQFLQQIESHYDIYQIQVQQELFIFVKLVEFRLQKIDVLLKDNKNQQTHISVQTIYQILFPGIVKLIQLILKQMGSMPLAEQRRKFIQYQRSEDNSTSQEYHQIFNKQLRKILNYNLYQQTQNEKLFFLRIKELVQKKHLTNYTPEGQMSVSKSISKLILNKQDQQNMFQIYSRLDQIFGISGSLSKETSSEEKIRFQQNKNHFFDDIEHEKIQSVGCVGCSRFFYRDMNIYEPTQINYPLKVFPKIEQIVSIEAQIKDTICGMLNSGGGIILFDCQLEYQYITVKGAKLTEKEKQSVEHKLGYFFQNFYPKVTPNQVSLSFVPVYENPMKQNHNDNLVSYEGDMALIKESQYYYKRIAIPGLYVSRLIISPVDRTSVYFYSPKCKQLSPSYFCNTFKKGQHKKVNMRSLAKLIKQKLKKYSNTKNMSQMEFGMIKHNFFNHKCIQPEAGNLISESAKRIRSQIREQIKRQQSFENIILMVCGGISKEKAKKYFFECLKRSVKYRIEAQIFPKFKFERAVNTMLLYHNEKFQFIYDKFKETKFIQLINVLHSLRIEVRRQDQIFFDALMIKIRENVAKEFPNENIKLQIMIPENSKNRNVKNEYYITTGTKEAALFVYFFISKEFRDVGVYFKYPDKYNKISGEQIVYKRKEYIVRKHYLQSQIYQKREYGSIQQEFASKWNQNYKYRQKKRKNQQVKFKQTCSKKDK